MSSAAATHIPATALTDPQWVRDDLATARRMYGPSSDRVLATVRWYSLSSVLMGPPLEALVRTGTALDPALEATTFEMLPDGRVLRASCCRTLSGDLTELGARLSTALTAVIDTLSDVSGAARPALWAVAGDSISNRLLWAGMGAGDVEYGTRLAGPLAEAIGRPIPKPRFVQVGGNTVLRRASCCLIYEATGLDKCVSCPRQHPEQRERRLRGYS